MAEEQVNSTAAKLFAAHPELRRAMEASSVFPAIRDQARITPDGEDLFIVMGDALGGEEDLYVDALVQGSVDQGGLNRAAFDELDEPLKAVVRSLAVRR